MSNGTLGQCQKAFCHISHDDSPVCSYTCMRWLLPLHCEPSPCLGPTLSFRIESPIVVWIFPLALLLLSSLYSTINLRQPHLYLYIARCKSYIADFFMDDCVCFIGVIIILPTRQLVDCMFRMESRQVSALPIWKASRPLLKACFRNRPADTWR
jgi:hypothetical protein